MKIKLEDDMNKHNNQVEDALKTVNDYMNTNSLVLNRDKSRILVITNNNDIRDNIKVKVPDKDDITPVRNMIYLGIQVQDDLKWNYFLTDSKDNLVKRLKNKINAIKMIRRYLSTKTTKMIFNGVFMSTLLYGATLWQGAPLYLKKKIQSLQLEAARTTIGKKLTRWSTLQLLKEMNWIPVEKILQRESAISTHKILNTMNPEHMNYKMTTKYNNKGQDLRTTRTTGQGKLGSQLKQIGRTRTTNYHYRVSAYKIYAKIPQELTDMKDPKAFKKWINRYLINPKFLPSILKNKKNKNK